MAGDRQLEVHQRLDARAIEVKYPIGQVEQAEGGRDAENTQHRGHTQDDAHVPGLRLVAIVDVVIGDREDGAVVEQG